MLEPSILAHPIGDDPPIAHLYYGHDARTVLRQLPPASVHMVATSPPYWGLRDYGVEGQLGAESTPTEYVNHLVEIFREVKRVLRPDGTLWLNLGDSYTSGGRKRRAPDDKTTAREMSYRADTPEGLKSKDLVGVPWRVAFALQADGWYLRSNIIWHKENCMPESVRDRPTTAHEFVFLLAHPDSKGRYFYDHNAIREPHQSPYSKDTISKAGKPGGTRPKGNNFSKQQRHKGEGTPRTRAERAALLNPKGRNKRTVWAVHTKPYQEAHFAVWPHELVEPMVMAGTSAKGVCGHCGAPWEQVREVWQPTCICPKHEPQKAVVLDPFSGSGTTGAVAFQEGRNYIGIDLNAEYLPLAESRLARQRIAHDHDYSEFLGLFGAT